MMMLFPPSVIAGPVPAIHANMDYRHKGGNEGKA